MISKKKFKELYLSSSLSLEECCYFLDISPERVKDWCLAAEKKGEDWTFKKVSYLFTENEKNKIFVTILSEFKTLHNLVMKDFNSHENIDLEKRVQLLGHMATSFHKISKASKDNSKVDRYTILYEFMNSLVAFTQEHHPDLSYKFSQILKDFIFSEHLNV